MQKQKNHGASTCSTTCFPNAFLIFELTSVGGKLWNVIGSCNINLKTRCLQFWRMWSKTVTTESFLLNIKETLGLLAVLSGTLAHCLLTKTTLHIISVATEACGLWKVLDFKAGSTCGAISFPHQLNGTSVGLKANRDQLSTEVVDQLFTRVC